MEFFLDNIFQEVSPEALAKGETGISFGKPWFIKHPILFCLFRENTNLFDLKERIYSYYNISSFHSSEPMMGIGPMA